MTFEIICDDMREALARMEPDSVDAAVTDPPYELGFMNRAWDRTGVAFDVDTWRAVYRVLKPGAYLVAFGGTRTWHRIACAIEDAGFEIRDSLAWCFGSGFPKSMNVNKEIMRRLRESDGKDPIFVDVAHASVVHTLDKVEMGTALKPFFEPIVMARKPPGMPIVECVMKHGTGAINVGGCRIAFASAEDESEAKAKNDHDRFGSGARVAHSVYNPDDRPRETWNPAGRWPPNLMLDGEAAFLLDLESGDLGAADGGPAEDAPRVGPWGMQPGKLRFRGDTGGASRFCYVAKADEGEREAGLEGLPITEANELVSRKKDSAGMKNPRAGAGRTSLGRRNVHATVKPIDVMRWLVRLITPLRGRVLDPFAGSGSTLVAGIIEGRDVVGVEMETNHATIAWHRCERWSSAQLAPGVDGKIAARKIKATDETKNLDLFSKG